VNDHQILLTISFPDDAQEGRVDPPIIMVEHAGVNPDSVLDLLLIGVEAHVQNQVRMENADSFPQGNEEIVTAIIAQTARLRIIDAIMHLPFGAATGSSIDL
jgi:hypothetical protein